MGKNLLLLFGLQNLFDSQTQLGYNKMELLMNKQMIIFIKVALSGLDQ